MKRIYLLAIAIMSLVLLPSCNPKEEEVTLEITTENICGHWVEKECTYNGKTYDTEGASAFTLKADGSFHYTGAEVDYDGNWEMKGTVLCESYEEGSSKFSAEYNVDKLTNRTLILSQDGGSTTTYKRK